MKEKREIQMTGISQVTVNWKWIGAIVAILLVFVSCVGWMYITAATARPATVHTGGY